MADSIREQIIQSVVTICESITPSNGYETNTNTVDRIRKVFESDELPAVNVSDGNESLSQGYNADLQVMEVVLEHHCLCGALNRSTVANKVLADLKKAFRSGDTTHGGIAERTVITERSVNYPDTDDNQEVQVSITLQIDYEEIAGDPYTST